jgi:ABC-2 type transport system permease protein
MKRYFKLTIAFISISAKRYMESRWNTFNNIIASILSLVVTIIFVNSIFRFTGDLNGWTQGEVLLVLGGWKMMMSIFYTTFQRSINFLPIYVRDGELDHMLTKPINTRFLISFRLNKPFEIISVISGIALFSYALMNLNHYFSVMDLLLLCVNLFLGLVILYSIYYSLACLVFWFGNFSSLNVILFLISNPMQYPTNIYNKSLSFLITYLIPIGLVITIPVSIFLERTYYLTILEIVFATILFVFSNWFWNFALKHYTSASS